MNRNSLDWRSSALLFWTTDWRTFKSTCFLFKCRTLLDHTALHTSGRGSLQLGQVLLEQGEAVSDLGGGPCQGGDRLLHPCDGQGDLLRLQPPVLTAVHVGHHGGVRGPAVVVGGRNSRPEAVGRC